MPLTAFVQGHIDRIRAFLVDPEAVVLEVRAAGEQQALVGKLLVGLAQEGDDLYAAVDAEQSADWPAEIAAAVELALVDAAKEFAAAQIELRMPPPVEPPETRPKRSAEHRVMEYCERVALALVPFLRGLVVAIRAPSAAAAALPLAQTLGRLVGACEGGRVRFVVLTTPEVPIVREVAVPRVRTTVWAPGDRSDLRDLRRVALEPEPRVLAYDAPRRGQLWMPGALVEAGLADGVCIVRVDDVRFWKPIHFYGRAAELAVRACAKIVEATKDAARIDPFRAEVAAPCGREDAELVFADLLDRLQREALPPDWDLAIVLAPCIDDGVPPAELADFAASVQTLARALVSPRVSVYALAPGLGALPKGERAAFRVQALRIDAPVIEDGLVKKLAEPDLPPVVRLRCMAALASLRMGQGEPEAAIDLATQTLALAHEMDDPIEIAAAWHGLGSSLYRCGALDKASDAYARCTDLAVGRDHAVLAAQGITGMAHCEFVVGHCDRAIEYYGIAVKYWRNMGNLVAEAYTHMWIAESHAKAGRVPTAMTSFDDALACCDRTHETMQDAADSMRADILQRKARVYGRVGLTAEKRKHTDVARELGASAPPSEEP